MDRRELIKSTLLAAGAVSTRGALSEDVLPKQDAAAEHFSPHIPHKTGERGPNILWVVTDQQRLDTFSGLGNPLIHTPNLDKFMTESTVFTNAFVQTPICAPSRGSFMTGRYPHTTALHSNGQWIRPTERLIPRLLADQGYTCGLAGKLHLSPTGEGRVEERIDDGYTLFEWSHDISNSWPGHNAWVNWLQANNVPYDKTHPPKGHKGPVWGMEIDPKYTQTAWCCGEGIKFLRANKGKPWMMSVHMFQPHAPFHPTAEYLARIKPGDMPKPAYRDGELTNKPIFQTIDHQGAYGGHDLSFEKTSAEDHQAITAAYYAMIEQVDTSFGDMMKALEETGQADNTVVIFMSDHGEMLGDHGIYFKGPYFYDCLTRVPLMMRWPGKYKANQKITEMVELVDIAPTLLEAAGLQVPCGIQGRSLRPYLMGEPIKPRDSVHTEYFNANARYTTLPMCTSVRTKDHKVSYYGDVTTGELYDLKKDPGEFDNLWNTPHAADVQLQMMTLLAKRMIETTDPLPVRPSWF